MQAQIIDLYDYITTRFPFAFFQLLACSNVPSFIFLSLMWMNESCHIMNESYPLWFTTDIWRGIKDFSIAIFKFLRRSPFLFFRRTVTQTCPSDLASKLTCICYSYLSGLMGVMFLLMPYCVSHTVPTQVIVRVFLTCIIFLLTWSTFLILLMMYEKNQELHSWWFYIFTHYLTLEGERDKMHNEVIQDG